jgi:hypothetical protein
MAEREGFEQRYQTSCARTRTAMRGVAFDGLTLSPCYRLSVSDVRLHRRRERYEISAP